MTVRAAWLPSTGQTREDTRLTLAALLTPSGQSSDETPCAPARASCRAVSR